jgi:hypothetical protein
MTLGSTSRTWCRSSLSGCLRLALSERQPSAGPIEGSRLVFIDVEEPAGASGAASITCQFGEHPARPGEWVNLWRREAWHL